MTDIPEHLDFLLRNRYRMGRYSPLVWGRYSINRAEPVAAYHPPDGCELYGPSWGSSASVYRTGPVRPYVGIPLDENGFIETNKPFYHATSGAVLSVVPPPPGAFCPQVVSDAFDPVNGERLGKVPNACYKVEVLQQGTPVSGEITTEQGSQKPSPEVAPPAALNIWDWLKLPVHGKIPIPRGLLIALAGVGIGYYALK